MALYVPAARRRQRAIAVGVAGLVIGMFLGWLVGRGSAPSLEDRVAAVQADAAAVVQRLEGLPARTASPGGDGDVTVTTSAAGTGTTAAAGSSGTAGSGTAGSGTGTGGAGTTSAAGTATTVAVDLSAELDAIRRDLDDVVDRAPWISDRTAALLDQQLSAVAAAATRDPALFATATRAAVAALNLAFGLNS